MDAVVTPAEEEPEERIEGDDYEYEADEEEPKNKFPDLCSKINCDEFAKVKFWALPLYQNPKRILIGPLSNQDRILSQPKLGPNLNEPKPEIHIINF